MFFNGVWMVQSTAQSHPQVSHNILPCILLESKVLFCFAFLNKEAGILSLSVLYAPTVSRPSQSEVGLISTTVAHSFEWEDQRLNSLLKVKQRARQGNTK